MNQNSQKCFECQKPCDYDEFFDAYFCKTCNRWNEKDCEDPHCTFCKDRPDKPIIINKISIKNIPEGSVLTKDERGHPVWIAPDGERIYQALIPNI